MRCPLILLLVLVPVVSATPPPQRPEFEAIARTLRESDNPYVGTALVDKYRQALEESETLPLNKRYEAFVGLALELLKHGDIEGAARQVDDAFAIAAAFRQPGPLPFVYRARALVNLRRAEYENCIARHNRECCIFPLQGGGVHGFADAARQARDDYVTYLETFPNDLGVVWLLNLTCMALDEYPDGVPDEFVIPPQLFESEYEVGRFVDVAGDAGVDTFNLCGGAIVDDFDGDDRLDIVTSTFDLAGPLAGYRNVGDGTFEDIASATRLDDQLGGLNCIGADYDNDGDIDVFVLRGAWLFDDGRIRNSLLRREQDGTMTDVTREAGLADPATPTQAAAWADFDGDGHLDLYIANESRPEDGPAARCPAQLFRNRGDGTFTDIASSAGVDNDMYAKGVATGDFDNDGDVDIYVSNFGPNRLYRNNSDGTFTDVAAELGVRGPLRSFASWFFDYDNDGWLDIFVAAYEAPIAAVAADHLGLPFRASPPALYRNKGDGTYTEVTSKVGLAHAYLPMGASFGDLDNDGWLDIYLATGDPSYESLMPNVMLRNAGGERFQNVTASAGLGHLQKGHGVVFADIDNDGDQDIYHQLGGFFAGDAFHNALFMNPGHGHRHLKIRLVGTKTNRSGYGARITVVVRTAEGLRSIHRAVGSVSSFGASPRRQEIGLGDATAIERVEITWPVSGTKQTLTDVPLDSMIEVTEGTDGYREVSLPSIKLQ
jgi:hypothetical protein